MRIAMVCIVVNNLFESLSHFGVLVFLKSDETSTAPNSKRGLSRVYTNPSSLDLGFLLWGSVPRCFELHSSDDDCTSLLCSVSTG